MFCVIYRFTVKSGQDVDFQSAWHGLTVLIREHQCSLGSRLHRAAEGQYIAYAQWPCRERWKEPPPLPGVGEEFRKRMREACERVEVLHELEVVEDLLARSE